MHRRSERIGERQEKELCRLAGPRRVLNSGGSDVGVGPFALGAHAGVERDDLVASRSELGEGGGDGLVDGCKR